MSEAEDLWRRLELVDGFGGGVEKTPAEKDRKPKEKIFRELAAGTDASDLRETGWAVLYGPNEKTFAEPRLSELLTLRRKQAGDRFRELEVPIDKKGICISGQKFLFEHIGEAPGVVDIKRLPYYVLIVASPQEVSFEFQYELAINRAVGRLYFDDKENYRKYAATVKAVEEAQSGLKAADPKRSLGFFFVDREFKSNGEQDTATPILDEYLVRPVTGHLREFGPNWEVPIHRAGNTGRAKLRSLLQGGDSRGGSGWVVASHGRSISKVGHPEQAKRQGALVCGDGAVYGEDLKLVPVDRSPILGKTFFLTACFGAGTPEENEFESPIASLQEGDIQEAKRIAANPFVASLPQQLLANGALGVFGHVGSGLTATFRWLYKNSRTEAARSFNDMLVRFLRGSRLGHALRPMARRASNISAHFLPYLRAWMYDRSLSYENLDLQWGAWTDARNFILLGDPAAQSLQDQPGGPSSAKPSTLPPWRPQKPPTWETAGQSDDLSALRWAVMPSEKASEWQFDPPAGSYLPAERAALNPASETESDLVLRLTEGGPRYRDGRPPSPRVWRIEDAHGQVQSPSFEMHDQVGKQYLHDLVKDSATAHLWHQLAGRRSDPRFSADLRFGVGGGLKSLDQNQFWTPEQTAQLECRNHSEHRIWIQASWWSIDPPPEPLDLSLDPETALEPGESTGRLELQRPDQLIPFSLFPPPDCVRVHLLVLAATIPQALESLITNPQDSLFSEVAGLRRPSYRWLSYPGWSLEVRSFWLKT